jgi:hypothetical protein
MSVRINENYPRKEQRMVSIFIRDIPREIRDSFKALCVIRGITIRNNCSGKGVLGDLRNLHQTSTRPSTKELLETFVTTVDCKLGSPPYAPGFL